MTVWPTGTVVPAIPPRPPQVTLLGSSVRPGTESDPAVSYPTGEQLALLPEDLRQELEARKGEEWVRGFGYAPENHGEGTPRDRCDFTTVDLPALPAPLGLVLEEVAGGTVTAAAHKYQVTAVNGNGETTPCALVTITLGTPGSVKLTWDKVADNAQYSVYGRTAGSIGLLATVGPFDNDEPATWTDLGSVAPGAVPPVSNTTGGPGVYTNPADVFYIPFLINVEDSCTSLQWQTRDYKGRALRWLENAQYKAVEKEFWTGALAQAKGYPNNWLTNTASVTDVTPGTIPSMARGLQVLQDALAQCGFGGQGMIHVQPQTAPNLLGARRVGKLLLDVFDNIIVPGVGYDGSKPGGDAPDAGTAWMYATDLVMTRTEDEGTIFPDSFAEALDRGQGGSPNLIEFRAQKFAAAYFDGQCHFACEVNLAS